MADKKFTDEEIIKGLELCSKSLSIKTCQKCPFYLQTNCVSALKLNAIDLINRQKSENLELKLKVNELLVYKQEVTKNNMKNYETYKSQKAEIEKLKSNYSKLCEYAEKKEFELAEINADISWFREAKFSKLAPAIKEIKAEACKEFAEKLKEIVRQNDYLLANKLNSIDRGMFTIGFEQAIDEILKEMVGEDE